MSTPARQAGFTLVELLIGITLSLFLAAGATKFFVDYLHSNRLMLAETRLNQDLRAVMDTVARDLRRAGYWSQAVKASQWPPAANPYQAVTPTAGATASVVTHDYDATGYTGFRISNAVLEAESRVWQEFTDPQSVRITAFSVTSQPQEVSLGSYCTPACTLGEPGCPSLIVRRFLIRIEAQSTADAGIVRRMEESVRVRNDEVTRPTCP
jgi:prepilin peptidase dependent protein B